MYSFADGYRYAPYYLEKAAESSNLERMKLVKKNIN